jgi:hypothetical protein
MNTKNTWVWLVFAAVLFASIFVFDRYLRPVPEPVRNILSGLQPSAVTSVQVTPAGALEIRADRKAGSWQLVKPIVYPAQPAAIGALLGALQKLTQATRITAADLHEQHATDADFGFDPPQSSIVIEAGDQRWQLRIGNKTPPGDQVYLRVVGMDGAFVVDAAWLKFIPSSVNEWRDTALVDAPDMDCDWIIFTNNTKVIELRRDATNHLWRMIRPLHARANDARITDALQQLQAATITQFVTDDPKADLTTYGLQPADLDLWLGRGTNFVAGLHAGKNPPGDATQVYVQREGWNTVATTAKAALAVWHGAVNDFRDPYLLELNAPVAEIEVRGEYDYTLQREGANGWKVAGEKFPADADSVQSFIQVLASLRVAEFTRSAVTTPDLPAYGLDHPSLQITLRSAVGDTNAVITQLMFGTNQDNKVYVRRPDEDFIYAISTNDFNRFPESGWEFRDLRIWNFKESDVVQITLHQNGQTREILHNGVNKWSLAPGSQGIINSPAIEETTHRFGGLATPGWVARGLPNPERLGFRPGNLSATFQLKAGQKLTVDFGAELPSHTALAAVTLEGERWVFVFPPVLYQFVTSYLVIPPNTP